MQRKIHNINSLHPVSADSNFSAADISYLQPILAAFPKRKMRVLETGQYNPPRLHLYAFRFIKLVMLIVYLTIPLMYIVKWPEFKTSMEILFRGKEVGEMTVLEKKCHLVRGGKGGRWYGCEALLDYQAGENRYQSWVSYTKNTNEELTPPKEAFYLENHLEKAVFEETMRPIRWQYAFLNIVSGFMIWGGLYYYSIYHLGVRRIARLERFKKNVQSVLPVAVRYRYMWVEKYDALCIAIFVPWKKCAAAYSWFMPSTKKNLFLSAKEKRFIPEELSFYEDNHRHGPHTMSNFEQPFWIPGKITHIRSFAASTLLGFTSRKPALAVLVANSTTPLLLDEKLTRLDFTDEERHRLYEARDKSVRLFEKISQTALP